MKDENSITRRMIIKSSFLGLLAASAPNVIYAKNIVSGTPEGSVEPPVHERYPAIQLEVAGEVVGASHFKLDRLKELVNPRPELAKSVWDWGFGDWESAIGAASHVGRKDIVEYLVSKGAMPTVFTFAMLGEYELVKGMIENYPGIQRNLGPHGISLLKHAELGLEEGSTYKVKAQKLVDFLLKLGDADGRQYLTMDEKQKEKYIGDYQYGSRKEDGFTIKINMRKLLALGKTGKSGGSLLQINENEFTYQGSPSVTVTFQVEGDKVLSLTVHEPGLVLKATKV